MAISSIQRESPADTYTLAIYEKGKKETFCYEKGEDGSLYRNNNGCKEELYRYDGCQVVDLPNGALPCENYNDIIRRSKPLNTVYEQQLFYETAEVMRDYYAGKTAKEDVEQYVSDLCSFARVPFDDADCSRIRKSLETVYSYLSRANTRCAVDSNQKEAERLYIESGLRQKQDYYTNIKGSVYYNSEYYYRCEEMQDSFRAIIDKIADQCGLQHLDYSEIESNSLFPDGGITYNGVWNQAMLNTNHYLRKDQILAVNDGFIPPRDYKEKRKSKTGRTSHIR